MMAVSLFEFAKDLPPWVVLVFGVFAGGLRTAWSFVYEHTVGYLVNRVTISLTVEDIASRDAYVWLSCWAERHLRGRKVNSLLLRLRADDLEPSPGPGGAFDMMPAYGTYYLLYRRRLMTVSHWKTSDADFRRGAPIHTIRLQIWLCWDRTVLLSILEEARSQYEARRAFRIESFRGDSYGGWNGTVIAPRPVESVFHPRDLMDELLRDVQTFLGAKRMYEDLGIPYRRGYLLAGPPGTGKSSLILAVASHFGLPVYLVPLRGAELTGEQLALMLSCCRKPALVALEDVDCLQVTTSRESKSADGLTMADVLNAIDGIGASEDRVLFMTANHPERLDAALTRAGRVDRRFFIDYARDEELRRFHERVARYSPVPPWPEFRAALPVRATIADAQALVFSTGQEIQRECVGQGV